MTAAKVAQRTPGPWNVQPQAPRMIEALSADIAKCFEDRSDGVANAAFIVRACNAHDDLVAALQRIAHGAAVISKMGSCGEERVLKDIAHIARSAIAKAES